ncbi:uncharacterized protein [Clytia hemisphaerica]|uniref:Uncharacterized protein n=1 Tax=Clytia hemisphaerica TaxID=252671 RepID=A0A7M5XC59_9CNID
MDGLMVQNTQDTRPSLSVRGKGAAPRRALANIQNTHHTKSVTFENGAIQKPACKPTQLKNIRTLNATPLAKPLRKLSEKPSTVKKGLSSTTPFKIFEDGKTERSTKQRASTSTKTRKKIDIFNDEIEYMPPCTDKEVEVKMPSYLQKACLHKPIYNISTPSFGILDDQILKDLAEKSLKEVNESKQKEFERLPTCLDTDENLDDFIQGSFAKLSVIPDEELFAQLENDDSFSLETLDREIQQAGLDPPNW